MYFVKAGFRTLSLDHLAMIEDGAEEPNPKVIPPNVVRATIDGGRVVDFEGEAAEMLRLYVKGVTVTKPPSADRKPLHGHKAEGEAEGEGEGGSPDATEQRGV